MIIILGGKKMKKIIAMFVAALMLCSVFAVTALAVNLDPDPSNSVPESVSESVPESAPNSEPVSVIVVDGQSSEEPGAQGYVGTEKKSPDTGDSLIFPAAFVLLSGAVVAAVIGGKKKSR